MSLILILLLVTVAFLWMRREKLWQQRWEGVARSLGLKTRHVDQLPAHASAIGLVVKNAEQLAGQRRVFESLLDEISQGAVLVGTDLRIRFANQAFRKLLGQQNAHKGQLLIEVARDHQIVSLVQETLRDKRRTTRRIQLLPQDGGSALGGRHYFLEAAPLPDETADTVWMTMQDITESVQTEQIRRDFVANASHELRTPLTLINGYIEMLQEDAVSASPRMQRSLSVMEKHGKRITRIVEDMLTISRLEDVNTPLNVESFSVRTCTENAADHLAPMLEEIDARIVFSFPEKGDTLDGDPFYWDQVFANLIENSIKENNRAGLVIHVSGEWLQDYCVLKVSDNGIGITAHDLPFVFKRFYRGQKHHSSHVRGTGLGLSIVKRAVEAHGGAITVTSTPGQETTFTIRVPLRHTQA